MCVQSVHTERLYDMYLFEVKIERRGKRNHVKKSIEIELIAW